MTIEDDKVVAGEIAALAALLDEDYFSLSYVEGEDESGDFLTVEEKCLGSGRWEEHLRVVTRGPSGNFYAWEHSRGLTEYQPNERYDKTITQVYRKEKTVTKVYYTP